MVRLHPGQATAGRRFAADQRGSTAVAFAIALLPLMAAAGAAIDYSRASQVRAKLQSVVDAAVLVGLKTTSSQRVATAEAYARSALAAKGVAIDLLSFAPTTNQGLRGRARVRMTSLFGKLLGDDGIHVAAGSEGFVRSTASSGSNVCLMLMDASAAETLRVNGGATVKAPNCEVHVHTAANVGAVFNGNASFDVKRICLKSSGYIASGSPKLGPVEKNCAAAADPYVGQLPKVGNLDCTYSDKVFAAPRGREATELQPGVYCGDTQFNGSHDIRLKPGLYVIKDGTMTVNGGSSIAGTGVTFHFANARSSLRLNGNSSTRLAAPVDPADQYSGILMFEPNGLSRTGLVLDGGSGHQLEGLVYLPSRNVTFNGASKVDGDRVTMVLNSLVITGGGGTTWTFDASGKTIKAPASSTGTAEIILRY